MTGVCPPSADQVVHRAKWAVVAGVLGVLSCAGTLPVQLQEPSKELQPMARLGEPRYAHSSGVLSMVFSKDGRHLFAGTEDGGVWVWTYPEGKLQRLHKIHQGFVTALASLPDGSIMSGGVDGKLRRIIGPDFNSSDTPTEIGARITGLSADSRGKKVYVSTADDEIIAVDLLDGVKSQRMPGHSGGSQCVEVSRDGRYVVSGGVDGRVRVRDLELKRERIVSPGGLAISSIAISNDGTTLVACSLGKGLTAWDLATGALRCEFGTPAHGALAVRYSPDGSFIASGGMGGVVRIWNASDFREIRSVGNLPRAPTLGCLAISSDGKAVASQFHAFGFIDLYNVETGKEIQSRPGHHTSIRSIGFSPRTGLLGTGGVDGRVILWDVEKRLPIHSMPGHQGTVWATAFSQDGERLATSGADKFIRIWNVKSGKELRAVAVQSDRVTALAFADDTTLISADCDGQVIVWNSFDGTSQRILRLPKAVIRYSLVVSPDGKYVVVGAESRNILILTVPELREVRTLPVANDVISLAFSPDGTLLVATSIASLYVWNFLKSELIVRFPIPEPHLEWTDAVFSSTGAEIVAARDDGRILLLDIATQRTTARLAAHLGRTTAVRTSPNRQLFAAGSDSTVAIFSTDAMK